MLQPVMRRALFCLALAACTRGPERFESRKEIGPLRERLRASGGDLSRVIHVRAQSDLARLESGERYKFAIPEDGRFRVAPRPLSEPGNEYVHPVLVDGARVRTAGNLIVKLLDGAVSGVMIDRDSRAYCPSQRSVSEAISALRALGIPRTRISVDPVPPHCEASR